MPLRQRALAQRSLACGSEDSQKAFRSLSRSHGLPSSITQASGPWARQSRRCRPKSSLDTAAIPTPPASTCRNAVGLTPTAPVTYDRPSPTEKLLLSSYSLFCRRSHVLGTFLLLHTISSANIRKKRETCYCLAFFYPKLFFIGRRFFSIVCFCLGNFL